MRVPKQIWTYCSSTNKVPEDVVTFCIESWKRHNRDHEVVVLNDANLAEHRVTLPSGTPQRTKSDLVMLLVLRAHGGIWMDATIFCDGPVTATPRPPHDMVCYYLDGFRSTNGHELIESWFIAAPKGSRFVAAWCDELLGASAAAGDGYLSTLRDRGVDLSGIDKLSSIRRECGELHMYAAAQAVSQQKKGIVLMLKAQDGPLRYLEEGGWHRERSVELLFSDTSRYASPIAKLGSREQKELVKLAKASGGFDAILRNPTEYVVISLEKRDTKRDGNLKKTLATLHGQNVRVHTAVDGYDVDETLCALDRSSLSFTNLSFLTYGTLACFLSKFFVLESFVEENKKTRANKFICLLEDDVVVTPSLEQDVKDAAAALRRGEADYSRLCHWGECYVASLQGAENLVRKFRDRGIFENVDNEMRILGDVLVPHPDAPNCRLVVDTNAGDNLKTPPLDFRVFLGRKRTAVRYINLDREKSRRRAFVASYDASDLEETCGPAKRFAAIDGHLVELAALLTPAASKQLAETEKNGHRRYHYELTRGAIGCFVSHLQMCQDLVDDRARDAYIVFEDDVAVSPDFYERLSTIALPPVWHVLLLYTHRNIVYKGHVGDTTTPGLTRIHGFWGTQCYIVNKRGAHMIVQDVKKKRIDAQIDSKLSRMTHDGLVVYATDAALVRPSHKHHSSSIQVGIVESKDAYMYDGYKVV